MKSLLQVLAFLMLFHTSGSFASALMTIQGKLESFTDRVYVIRRGDQLFHIKKSAIPPQQQKTMDQPGAEVTVSVAPSAIERVRTAK